MQKRYNNYLLPNFEHLYCNNEKTSLFAASSNLFARIFGSSFILSDEFYLNGGIYFRFASSIMVFKKGVWIGLMLCSVQCVSCTRSLLYMGIVKVFSKYFQPAQNLIDFQNIFSGLESATALVTSSIELSILSINHFNILCSKN